MNTGTLGKPRTMASLALAALLTATVAATAPGTSDAASKGNKADRTERAAWQLAWKTDFRAGGDLQGWAPFAGVMRPDKSKAHYQTRNVFLAGDDLVLRSQRHCVKKSATKPALTDGNAHAGPCGDNRRSVYSSGRVSRDNAFPQLPAGDFRVTFRAKLPKPVKGTRSALWMKNHQPYCVKDAAPTLLGELDVLEWYGSKPRETTAVTHLSCHSAADPSTWQAKEVAGVDPDGYHTWSVTRSGRAITYRVGDRVVGRHQCGEGKLEAVAAQCSQILNDQWLLIMNGEVFRDTKAYNPPNDNTRFPDQLLRVDWVKVEQR